MDASSYFRGKKSTLMGLGLLGRGVGDARYLAECGADLLVTDLKTKEQLETSLAELASFPNIRYTLGEHKLEDFRNRDLIIKAAGVPLDSPYIAEAKKHNIPIAMSTALFAKYAMEHGVTVIGVTGTRGKSTVTHMIYFALTETEDPENIHLGGNVRTISTLALLSKIKRGDIAVLELDSWQLQGFGDAGISPPVAVFTNLMPDHLNYYHGDMAQYFSDKANIFKNQKPGDVLVVGKEIVEQVIAARPPVAPIVAPPIPQEWHLEIPGEHNRENAALAAEALRRFLEEEEIWSTLTSFNGVPGRLELTREVKGIKIYNDTTATTPEATLAALEALGKNIVLIAGGADKNLDMNKLLREIPKHCKQVILLAGTGTDRIKAELPGTMIYHSISEAVKAAFVVATPGDTILFSPAFASFGMFKNEYDRGDQFDAIIAAL
jgi:UDP-N-acetylmuramoylalanine--D-glutamate ligase